MRHLTKKEKAEVRAESLKRLRANLKPGDKVYCVPRHVSQSGMLRLISLFIIKNNEIVYLTDIAGHVLGWPIREKHGDRCIVVNGCGMDMGFHLVYCLSATVFPKGTKLPKGIKDGGYALKHEWV